MKNSNIFAFIFTHSLIHSHTADAPVIISRAKNSHALTNADPTGASLAGSVSSDPRPGHNSRASRGSEPPPPALMSGDQRWVRVGSSKSGGRNNQVLKIAIIHNFLENCQNKISLILRSVLILSSLVNANDCLQQIRHLLVLRLISSDDLPKATAAAAARAPELERRKVARGQRAVRVRVRGRCLRAGVGGQMRELTYK